LTVSGRPVLHLSLVFNYTVSGTAVGSYPAVNLLTSAASALLRFGLMRRTLVRPGWRARYGDAAGGWAFIIATEWALHHLQRQSVTSTVQRAELLMGFFDRLALYAFVRGTAADSPEDARRRWFGGGGRRLVARGVAGPRRVLRGAQGHLGVTRRAGAQHGRQPRRHRRFRRGRAAVGVSTYTIPSGRPLASARAVAPSAGLGIRHVPGGAAGEVVPFAAVVLPLVAGTVFLLGRKPTLGLAGA
jgi:hypothetical protein